MKGTTPEGVRSEQEASAWVRGMFGRVAHRYDLANHLLSFNIDKLWRQFPKYSNVFPDTFCGNNLKLFASGTSSVLYSFIAS